MSAEERVEPRIRELFYRARELLRADRKAFLERECAQDDELRRQAETMLEVDVEAGNPLQIAVELVQSSLDSFSTQELPDELGNLELKRSQLEYLSAAPRPEIENFEILDLLGGGGMGTVYLARQKSPFERLVAIKVIKPGLDSAQIISRFNREQQAMASLSHPSIARVLQAGMTERGQPYFAMELVDGPRIDEYCCQHQLQWPAILKLFLELCQAVQHAHDRGIIHRDLKPSNVMVSQIDDHPTIRLIDFGIAKALEADASEATQITELAQIIGTPLYMSPEQVTPEASVDTRTDVYSLGVLLYKLVCGTEPLEGQVDKPRNIEALRTAFEDYNPQRPSRRNPQAAIPPDLDWVILKAIAKEPEQRYASVRLLADDLRCALAGKPIQARPPSLVYRARKWAARQRQTILGVLVVLVFGGALGIVLNNRLGRDVEDAVETDLESQLNSDSASNAAEDSVTKDSQADRLSAVESQALRNALDIAESAKLSQMLQAFNAGRLDKLSEIELPRESDGSFLKSPGWESKSSRRSPSLRKLLTSLAHPEPARTFQHEDTVWGLDVSPDGRWLVTGCKDGYARVWDLQTGEMSHALGPHAWEVLSVKYSPSGDVLVTGDRDGFTTFWDGQTYEQLTRSEERDGGIQTLAWSDDGRWLAAGVRNAHVAVLDHAGEEQFQLYHDHPGRSRFEALCFHPGTHHLLTPDLSGRIAVWDLDSVEHLRTYRTGQAKHPITGFAFIGSQQQYLLAGHEPLSTLSLLDAKSGELLKEIETSSDYPTSISQSPDAQRMIVGLQDGIVMMAGPEHPNTTWSGKLWFKLHPEMRGMVPIRWLNSTQLLTAGNGGAVHLWDVDDLIPFQQSMHGMAVSSAQSGPWTAFVQYTDPSAGNSKVVLEIWDTSDESEATGQPLVNLPIVGSSDVRFENVYRDALLASSGKVAIVQQEGVAIHDAQSSEITHTISLEPTAQAMENWDAEATHVRHLIWSDSGERLAIVQDSGLEKYYEDMHVVMRVFEAIDNWKGSREIGRQKLGNSVRTPRLIDDGRGYIAMVRSETEECDYRRYNVATGAWRSLKTTEYWSAMAVSQDERRLALGAHGLEILDIETGQSLMSLNTRHFERIRFCDDDRIMLTLDSEKTIGVWHLPTRQLLGTIDVVERSNRADFDFTTDSRFGGRLSIFRWTGGQHVFTTFGQAFRFSQE